MHTFYVPPTQFDDAIATILGSELHHLRNVLRLKIGERIRIVDGHGSAFIAEVNKITTRTSEAKIYSREYSERTKPSLTLFQGIPKNDKMKFILQKTTELGVSHIVPITTEHSIQKPSENRIEQWNKILISATKQCKRTWLPELCGIQRFDECVEKSKNYGLSLLLWEKEKHVSIKSILKKKPETDSIAIWVGPEGGFSQEEIDISKNNGCLTVSLGSNTLKTETAAIAGITIVTYEYQI